jgi:hypothetical protein
LSDDLGRRWMSYMRAGDLAAAWRVSDQVLRSRRGPQHQLPRHLRQVWDGTPLAGRSVLVWCYHGLGDTIQFSRFIPRLKQIAASVTTVAQPELISLLGTMEEVGELVPLDRAEPPSAEVEIEVMELAHALRCETAALAAPVPYLHAGRRPPSTSGDLRCGVVWRAGDWDSRRSLGSELLEGLTHTPGTRWTILQRDPEPNRLRADATPETQGSDLLPLARVMSGLDLVISVDSMPAHLAGALGVPVWTLLHHQADWRWMSGDSSPWYPSMRLFRQEQPGDWNGVVRRVKAQLERLVAA